MNILKIISAAAVLILGSGHAYAAGDLPTKFSNQGSISNTRHNMTQRQESGGGPSGAIMDPYRNDYEDVCIYCHTPNDVVTAVGLPLWNRTMKVTTYTTYNQLGTASLTQPVSQPGLNSLLCLSCHDGQTAVDSIISMPGSGRYQVSQETSQDNAFLDTWNNTRGPDATVHGGLKMGECLVCHSPGTFVGASAPDFRIAMIGTDLRNDHPVGVAFPQVNGPGTNFNTPWGVEGTTRYFDSNGNGTMDSGDVRLYDTGGSAKVECGSCHDPHGVPSAGPGSTFKPTFLRVANFGSALCLTCHIK